jgi:hypothetical protein
LNAESFPLERGALILELKPKILHFRDKIVKQEFFGFFYPNFREADPDSK